jgi:hypothetical protein
MDYRHTEDFARQMEAAALRAPGLRAQAANAFWSWVFAGIARGARAMKTAATRPFLTSLRSNGS